MDSMFERLKMFAKREFGYDIKLSDKKKMTFESLFGENLKDFKEQYVCTYDLEYPVDSRKTSAMEDHNEYDFSDDLSIAA